MCGRRTPVSMAAQKENHPMQDAADSMLIDLRWVDGVAHLRFNSPKTLNAIGPPMARAFLAAVRAAQADGRTRALLLSGEGRAFMAGGDLQAFAANLERGVDTVYAILDPLNEALLLLDGGPHPVVTAVHGAVAGVGLSIAAMSDFVIASDDSQFVPAYARIAACPDGGGSWALPRLVGLRRALEIMLLGEPFDAPTAQSWGLVNRVVPRAELASQAEALALRLATGPTRAYGEIRSLLRRSGARPLANHLGTEREAFARCCGTDDFREGVSAFVEKRAANFQGR
jgi:2-(1,2-epoxy-1,2-dihydrophenyl)acetyl-CoA isomerase